MADEQLPIRLEGSNILFCYICGNDIGYDADITLRSDPNIREPYVHIPSLVNFDSEDMNEDQLTADVRCSTCFTPLGHKADDHRTVLHFVVNTKHLLLRDGNRVLYPNTRVNITQNWWPLEDFRLPDGKVYRCLKCGIHHAQPQHFREMTQNPPFATFSHVSNVSVVKGTPIINVRDGGVKNYLDIDCSGCSTWLGYATPIVAGGNQLEVKIILDMGAMFLTSTNLWVGGPPGPGAQDQGGHA